jgi:ferredoxin
MANPSSPNQSAWSKETPVRVATGKCLNGRHRQSKCVACMACPTGAVTGMGMSIAVRPEACQSCGLCAAVCPTEAFSVAGPPVGDLLRQVRDRQATVVEFACARKQGDATRTDAGVLLRVPCLAWVSSAWQLAFVAQGASALWLDDTLCAECSLATVHAPVVESVARTNALLRQLGRQAEVLLYSQSDGWLGVSRELAAFDTRKPVYSRRELFGVWRRSAVERATSATEQAVGATPAATNAGGAISQRSLLLSSLARIGPPESGTLDTTGLPLGEVAISDRCTACGLCAKVCPAGALTFRQGASTYLLDVAPSQCLGEACPLCRLICPAQAITVASRLDPPPAPADRRRMLRVGRMVPCAQCGAQTGETAGEPLCYICQVRRAGALRPSGQAPQPFGAP